MTTITAEKFIEIVQEAAKDSPREVRFVRVLPFDRHVRQGDIVLWRLKELPKGCTPRTDRQLALGTTIGSRHTIGESAKLYDLPEKSRNALLGPVIVLTQREEGPHPEHAHYSVPGDCVIQVGYLLDPKTRRAVQD